MKEQYEAIDMHKKMYADMKQWMRNEKWNMMKLEVAGWAREKFLTVCLNKTTTNKMI